MKLLAYLILFGGLLTSCKTDVEPELNGIQLLDKSIEASGGSIFNDSNVSFQIKHRKYQAYRNKHIARFSIETKNLNNEIHKATYANGFPEYFINNEKIPTNPNIQRYVNLRLEAVMYLSGIPHVFKQNGVITTRQEDVVIDEQDYFVLNITFPEGEGLPDDEFYLYINPETFYVDFYAEKYKLNGNEPTFVRLYNHRIVNSLLFADYYTFSPKEDSTLLSEIHTFYSKKDINERKHVQYTNIEVTPINE